MGVELTVIIVQGVSWEELTVRIGEGVWWEELAERIGWAFGGRSLE